MADKVLIIIPAYNEEETIYNTVTSLLYSCTYDYLIVNDGSNDRTSEILKKNNLNHVSLTVNLGIGGAMQTGYKYALRHGYDYAIQLDADGQHDPRDLEKLVSEMKRSKSDMVIGSRFIEKTAYKGSFMRRFGIYYFYYMLRMIAGIKVMDPTSGYRIVNAKIIKEFATYYPIDFPEVEVLVRLASKKYIIKEVKVDMNARQGGKSSITPFKSIYYMTKVTFFSIIRSVF
ncbi:glycosyltransferase family 2 protein [Ferdinandcohnia quinoae]|uniref:Glycosyltransferase family 2 protein n=1 Tax=Fredinandcohnia quinoae TaxID=2918902 RepID=A0AAW5E2U6_9BACI|nr:glycosyltransferase family 2 protein [Fredinandcohnia sp. SECRCQ15]MCH1625099.1 glycosyltransferase family 2 protein [Fredinandcohnia sp. SECRCQ15]